MAASSSTPLTSMMSASCSRDASSAGRVADIVVQFENRRPVCVVRRVYFVVSFDKEGRLDTRRFLQQQWALVESALGPVLAEPNQGDRILDAASRSIAQGGRWRPKADLAQLIDEAVLGRRWSRSAGHALALPKGDVRGYRQSATCRHPTRQEVVTPMTGFKVQPPYAGRQLEAHSLKRSLAASRRPQPVNRPMRPVRPQFDRPNRNCRAQGCDRAGSASDRLERLQIPAVRHKHFKCSCHIASYGHSARITRQPSCRRGVTRAGQQACGL